MGWLGKGRGQYAKSMAKERFGRWTVVSRANNSARSEAQWLCRCDCGAQKVVMAAYLRRGTSKSCGCLKVEVNAAKKGQPFPGRTPNLSAAQASPRAGKLDAEGRRVVRPSHYRITGEGTPKPKHAKGTTASIFGQDMEALAERRRQLAEIGRANTEEWARMLRAGKQRTTADAFAPENERWR
jgi:hypothetical protein